MAVDPNALLAAARSAATDIRHRLDHTDLPPNEEMIDMLVSSFVALDGWIARAGALPDAWSESSGPWYCVTCHGQIAGGRQTGWTHLGPDGAEMDADHAPLPGGDSGPVRHG